MFAWHYTFPAQSWQQRWVPITSEQVDSLNHTGAGILLQEEEWPQDGPGG